VTTRVRDFVTKAFGEVGYDLEWEGEGVDEKGRDRESGKILVEVDPRYYRLTEVDLLIGNPAKAKEKLGWVPQIDWKELCAEMVRADLVTVAKEKRGDGF
jgi:GDPmannose 4,6-dehydratase